MTEANTERAYGGAVLPVAAGPVITPMTVSDPDGLAEIIGPLRNAGHAVHHVTLLASRDVLLRRRRTRLETTRARPRGNSIAFWTRCWHRSSPVT